MENGNSAQIELSNPHSTDATKKSIIAKRKNAPGDDEPPGRVERNRHHIDDRNVCISRCDPQTWELKIQIQDVSC